MAPRPCRAHIVAPVLASKAARVPPALPAITRPAMTAGVPSTAPSRCASQEGPKRETACTSRVAAGGWPSRARSPRYMVQLSALLLAGAGEPHELAMRRTRAAAL